MFVTVDDRLRQHGSFGIPSGGWGNQRTARKIDGEDEGLTAVEEDPTTSTRRLASAVRISQLSVWRILNNQLLYPYHVQRVQALSEHDYLNRQRFCEQIRGQESEVGALLQHSFFSFLSNHVLRFSLPEGLSVTSGGRALGDSFEINLGRAYEEARGKKKKQMMMMGAMMMAKAAMLGKMMMLIIKFKAIKALLLSIVALALAKIQLFKSLKNSGGGKGGGKETYIIIKAGKGGGGHGSPPSGGGGWSDSSGGIGGGGGGWSSGGGGGGWQADSGGGGGWSSGGGGGGGGGGGWSSGGGGGGGGGSSGWSGGGGGSGGWGRNYDASWLAYRAHAQNKTDT
ncbi:keratin, type I cytoskeletal 9-like [Macrosteles quadrilineatus]|uniref:keratin, type I cytoskeletal 9-like n=1 Tax=Macrosteles quadrilineatus TaxID=74068 RepID=UPI0023E21EA2|nr:keratin, type I cytoskeletal 9-like [Macrosteles quadrilineatus]